MDYRIAPKLKFPPDWEVQLVPPFGGAYVRFLAHKGDKNVSVYLDIDESLGYYGEPYWEIYPAFHGDTERFPLRKTKKLIKAIERSLNEY